MSINFTIENIFNEYFIDNNKRYSFVIYFNKKINTYTFVNSFINQSKLKLSNENYPYFIYLTINKKNTNVNINTYTYIQIKNSNELNMFFDKIIYRNKILSEKYKKTNKKIPTSFIFIDSEIIDNYIITSTKIFEKFKDILNNDICLHIQLAIITNDYNIIKKIKYLFGTYQIPIYKILLL